MKRYLVKIILLIIFALCGTVKPAGAVPSLGVATDTGIYAYTDPDALSDEYINYFADTLLPAVGEYEGFVIGPSGSSLTVFTNYNPATTQIYLLAATAGDNLPMDFAGVSLTFDIGYSFITGQAGGYKNRPYSYLALPSTGWTTQDFSSGTYFLYNAIFTYANEPWSPGYYLFAAAEINGVTPGLQYSGKGSNDKFSPKTTSAGGASTPEPASLFLLGSGLLGLAALGRDKRKKIS